MRAGRIGDAQAGAEIVRIGDAVEHQQQRRLRQVVEHVVERDEALLRRDLRHHALMPRARRHAVESRRIDTRDAHAARLGQLDEIAGAAVMPCRRQEDLRERPRGRGAAWR